MESILTAFVGGIIRNQILFIDVLTEGETGEIRLLLEQTRGYLIISAYVYFIRVCRDDRLRMFDDRFFELSITRCQIPPICSLL